MESTLKNASILITGANGGIGIETVKILMKKGVSRIVLACRTEKSAITAKKLLGNSDILEPYGGFDMQNPESINKAVQSLSKKEPFSHVFFQAGGMIVSKDFQFIQTQGNTVIEKTIFQNVLGAYITLNEMFNQQLISPQARIVFAGGEGARGIKGMITKPEYHSVDELMQVIRKGNGKYNPIDSLGVSKFMSALLVQELSERDAKHEYVWFSPGLTAGTKGLKNVSPVKRFMMEKIGFPFMKVIGIAQGPVQAAQKYVDCLDGSYGNSGDIIGAPEGKTLGKLVDQKPMNPGLTNHTFRSAFWNVANEVITK